MSTFEFSHRRLAAWREAIALVEEVYRTTEAFPVRERYGLTSQLRRAAVSIPSNIAEGAARGSDRDYIRFLIIARSSLSELDTELTIAVRLLYLHEASAVFEKLTTVSRLIEGLLRYLRRSAIDTGH